MDEQIFGLFKGTTCLFELDRPARGLDAHYRGLDPAERTQWNSLLFRGSAPESIYAGLKGLEAEVEFDRGLKRSVSGGLMLRPKKVKISYNIDGKKRETWLKSIQDVNKDLKVRKANRNLFVGEAEMDFKAGDQKNSVRSRLSFAILNSNVNRDAREVLITMSISKAITRGFVEDIQALPLRCTQKEKIKVIVAPAAASGGQKSSASAEGESLIDEPQTHAETITDELIDTLLKKHQYIEDVSIPYVTHPATPQGNTADCTLRNHSAHPEFDNNPFMLAFLDMLGYAEGTDKDFRNPAHIGYNVRYPAQTFGPDEGCDDHPEKKGTAYYDNKAVSSDASGRYQFMSFTWDPLAESEGYISFDPHFQDRGGISLAKDKRGFGGYSTYMDDATFEVMRQKLTNEWASIPGNDYGQNPLTISELRDVYLCALQARNEKLPDQLRCTTADELKCLLDFEFPGGLGTQLDELEFSSYTDLKIAAQQNAELEEKRKKVVDAVVNKRDEFLVLKTEEARSLQKKMKERRYRACLAGW